MSFSFAALLLLTTPAVVHQPPLHDLRPQRVYSSYDELGSVERLTDASAATIERYEYEGYGKFTVFGSSGLNWRWLFQGREYKPALGAYDFRARTLWPELGRFGQEDPAGAAGHPNAYQALLGNWTTNTDPSGEVVVLMHGIRDYGEAWASAVGQALGEQWDRNGADPGQDVVSTVNLRRSGWRFPGSEPGQFDAGNAGKSLLLGYVDSETQRVGENIALQMNQMRAVLNASKTRIGEPVQALAHSHGTAMLLAAARVSRNSSPSSMTWFRLKNVVFAGSDMDRYTDIAQLLNSADTVYNFYSSSDEWVGVGAAAGGGGVGFRDPSELLTRGQQFRSASNLIQREIPGTRHTGDPLERQYGRIPWMSRQLAMRYYASIFELRQERRGSEAKPWLDAYESLRKSMGLGWTIRLPEKYKDPYIPAQ